MTSEAYGGVGLIMNDTEKLHEAYIQLSTIIGISHLFLVDIIKLGSAIKDNKELLKETDITIDEINKVRDVMVKYMTYFTTSLHSVTATMTKKLMENENEPQPNDT